MTIIANALIGFLMVVIVSIVAAIAGEEVPMWGMVLAAMAGPWLRDGR